MVIPIYIQAGITGFESPALEYKTLGLSLDDLLITNPNATFIGLANGHSMRNKGIYSGDILIVDRIKKVKNGAVIVANFNGDFICKELDIVNKQLLSASDDYPPVNISATDNFQIEGVVPFSIRMHDKNARILSCMP